jgi:hypothetical protein
MRISTMDAALMSMIIEQLYKPKNTSITELFKKNFNRTIPAIAELQSRLILETNPGHSTIGLIQYLEAELKDNNLEEDFSNRSCATCSLGQEGTCELNLEDVCISLTKNSKDKDFWVDKDEL